ncbi:hypothetical protein A8F94_01030 [Bacillus sp. FJAT-27225]|uniref:hypothetical protein n=1 Tax=Bacillus sp. FJAT-27225 TaxID=1743144 RepID=UPI00080C21EE|nr:hypothetical protein [Bacillus sp. FJAT-27225]OCA90501.1 hypothetical protein A8F94_01030 [Bacillus sp. FJAT-27225]
MGLFVNKHIRNLFKTNRDLPANNQEEARSSRLSELIEEQQKTNKQLLESISEIKPRYDQLQESQTAQWNDVKEKIGNLEIQGQKREKFEHTILARVNQLDHTSLQNQNSLLANERLIKSVVEQVHTIKEAKHDFANRLERTEASQNQLIVQMDEQMQIQKDMAGRLANNEGFQAEVLERIDKQEALTDKIFHQLNHIRSIVFERTNYLATKIEEGYSLTSSYVYKLMTGSDQPLTFSAFNNKQKKESTNNDH